MLPEMVLNELSISAPASDIHSARRLMADLIDVLRIADRRGIQRGLRAQSGFQYAEIAPGYPVAKWRNDRQVDYETRLYFKTITMKTPLLAGLDDLEVKDTYEAAEFQLGGDAALGLGVAYLIDGLAVSLRSDARWDEHRYTLEMVLPNADGSTVSEDVDVVHASTASHLDAHSAWLDERIRGDVADGKDLWNRRSEMFPSLTFCDSARDHLARLGSGEPRLRAIVKKLTALHHYCEAWSGAFNPDALPFRVTPESGPTLSEFRKSRTFECPDGQARVFSLHMRLTPAEWRIHICPDSGTMYVGYIGPHLPTSRYRS